MGWSRQKAIASWQRCRSPKTCCLCVALPLQPEGCSRTDGVSAGSPEPCRAQRPAPQPREDFRPRGERKPRPLPTGGKQAPGARSSGGCRGSALPALGVGTGMLPGAPRRSRASFQGAPCRAAAAPASPGASPVLERGGDRGEQPPLGDPHATRGHGLSPRPLCPAPAGDKHGLNNGHVCSNMISPNNAE